MIERSLRPKLLGLARKFPIVTVTGPRQSGKTTLCRAAFPERPYVSFEAPDVADYARRDPRGLIAEYRQGAVFDEVQRVPAILSYLQGEVDEDSRPGRFILTGSANFALLESISQSLAGRTGVLQLLPLTLAEIRRFPGASENLSEVLWKGAYPALHDRRLEPNDWFGAYVGTYVERDVRQIININDLVAFQTFLRLAAGRTGQLLNASALGADAGITHNTARAWLSVLETSYLALRLPPFFANVGKRLVKTPKLHFYDSGMVCYLLGISRPEHLNEHPLRGAIFESWVVAEIIKMRANLGLPAQLFFYRDRRGLEVDAVLDRAAELVAVESKSGQTVAGDSFAALEAFAEVVQTRRSPPKVSRVLVYGGDRIQRRREATVVPWSGLDRLDWG